MDKKVSVIIPIFNASKTIEECLDSIVDQTIFRDLEVIIVDDCSTDDSIEKVMIYEERFPEQIMIVRLSENGGPGNARNIGFDYANGEYIAYVDSDDAIVPNMYELLYNEAIRSGADVIDSGFYDQRDETAFLYADDNIVGKLDDEKRSAMIVSGGYVFAKLFKQSFLIKNNIRFRKEYVLEDMDYLIEIFAKADSIGSVKETTYIYRDSEGSLSKTIELMKYIHSMSSAMAAIYEKTSGLPNYVGIREAVEYAMIHLYSNMINQCINEVYEGRFTTDDIIGLFEALRNIRSVCVSPGYDNQYVRRKIDEKSIRICEENDRSPKGLAKLIDESLSERKNSDEKKVEKTAPLISVIMPVRNNEKYFTAAVQSLLDQKFADWELIIVEGRSTDRTSDLADEIAAGDDRIRVEHYDEWIYESINRGISLSKGKYYMVLNSDDRLADNAMQIIADHLNRYDIDMFMVKVGTVVCDGEQNRISDDIEETEQIMPEGFVIKDKEELKNKWVSILASGMLNDQLNVYRTECVKGHKYRNDVYGADYLYNLEILPFINSAAYYPKCLYYFQVYNDVDGMNTSVGKYYNYAHSMFNEFYFRGLNLFVNNGCLSGEALYYLKKRRVMEYICSELPMYGFDSCGLSVEDKIKCITDDSSDIVNIVDDKVITAEIEDSVRNMCKQLTKGKIV